MADEIEIHLCAPGDEKLFSHIADDDRARETHPLFAAAEPSSLHRPRNGVIVGQLTALLNEHPEDQSGDLFFDEVGVAASVRRCGVATRLMQAAFALGRKLGCRDAWLGTQVENREARAFYESLGQRGRIRA